MIDHRTHRFRLPNWMMQTLPTWPNFRVQTTNRTTLLMASRSYLKCAQKPSIGFGTIESPLEH